MGCWKFDISDWYIRVIYNNNYKCILLSIWCSYGECAELNVSSKDKMGNLLGCLKLVKTYAMYTI